MSRLTSRLSILVVTILGLLATGCSDIALEADRAVRGELQRGAAKADGSNSCKDHCDGQAPAGCWCDEACLQHGDCCADKGQFCDAAPGSCVGKCGGMASGGCWCDEGCSQYGDCCADKVQACDATVPLQCSQFSDCAGCLATSGCNWTGGTCADTCLQDTDCYGPGNPAAPSCPSTPPPPPPSCDQATKCADCLAINSCNWTGGTCTDTCLQDTYCYGPGNPAAPSCPSTPPPPPPACSDITDEQSCKDSVDCERELGTCLMWCLPDDVGCCDFLGCKDKGTDSCAGAWLNTATGKCQGINDAILADSCCDTERKTACEKANQDYTSAITAAKQCSPWVTAPQCTFSVHNDLMCPCNTFVNNTTALKPLSDKWALLGCDSGMMKGWWGCPPIPCATPSSGLCETSGICSDQ